jgi:quercetin dioxygenase-like cupin family protein
MVAQSDFEQNKIATMPEIPRRITMKSSLSRKGKFSTVIVIGLVTILAGTALALSSISFTIGTVASFDFGAYGPGYPVPGTIQIQAFTMKPGDTVPWHYHKGVSYVVLSRGTLTEQHVVGPNQCDSEEVTAGSAFVEPTGLVHSVTNTGNDDAVIWWATIFPKSDGVVHFSPEFKSGGVYPANPPNCN